MELTGGCLCGAIRYRGEGPLHSRVHCHCAICRRASGAVAVSWVTVSLDHFAFTRGEPAIFRSSSHGERRFCQRCGSPLTFWTERDPARIDVTIGTLDRPDEIEPTRHIWTASRVAWLRLDEMLPAYPESGPPDIIGT